MTLKMKWKWIKGENVTNRNIKHFKLSLEKKRVE